VSDVDRDFSAFNLQMADGTFWTVAMPLEVACRVSGFPDMSIGELDDWTEANSIRLATIASDKIGRGNHSDRIVMIVSSDWLDEPGGPSTAAPVPVAGPARAVSHDASMSMKYPAFAKFQSGRVALFQKQ